MKKGISALLAVMMATTVMLSACGSSASESSGESSEETTQAATSASGSGIDYQYLTVNEDGTRTFEDMKGNTVTVPAEEDMDTILTVSWPGNAPTMVLLGLTDMIPAWMSGMKGDNYYWQHQYNPTIMEEPELGDTAEELMTYHPDIVFCKTNEVQEELTAAGLTAACMSPVTLDDVLKTVRLSAEISGRKEAVDRADAWIAYYNDTVSTIKETLADVSEEDYPVVYVVNGQHGDTPLLTNGSGTLTETFGELCKFKLATEGIVEGDAVEITAEQLMSIDPQYIEFSGMNAYDAYDNLMADAVLSDLSAVKNGALYFIPKGGQPMNGTGVENVMYIQWQTKLLYPDLFADVDMNEVVRNFYTTFMDWDISDEEIEAMLAGKNSIE